MFKHIDNRKSFFMLKENAGEVTYTKEDFDLADKKIRLCMTIVTTNTPFFAVLLKKLLIIPNIYIPTMATDGNAILYNPKFTNQLSEAECIFVIQHELLHCALQHFARMDGRDPKKWNYATDYAINYMLQEMYKAGQGGGSVMNGALIDDKYADMTSEQIYEVLDENGDGPSNSNAPQGGGEQDCESCDGTGEQDSGNGDSCNSGEDGDKEENGSGDGDGDGDGDGKSGDGKEPCSCCSGTGKQKGGGEGQKGTKPGGGWDVGGVYSPEELGKYYDDPDKPNGAKSSDLEKAWEVSLKKAVGQAGNLPGNVKRMLGDILDPIVNWRQLLKKYVNNFAKKNKYVIPNRRFVGAGKYLPGIKRDLNGITNIVVAIDTSGSVDDEMIKRYISEVYDILNKFKPEKTTILYIDTEVRSIDEIKKKGKPDLNKAMGGGGTAFAPAFTWIDENIKKHKDVSVVIYFTDLYGNTDFPKPKYHDRVIWALEKDSRHLDIPFGKKIIIDKNFMGKRD